MCIKILLVGDDPGSTLVDNQLLRERGLLVITTFNLQNIGEIIAEVKPDIVFFDPHKPNNLITDTYNDLVNDINFTQLPVIFTLSDDDVYLVTRKRTASKDRRTGITDNIIGAIKMALSNTITSQRKTHKIHHPNIEIPMLFTRA